MPRDKTLSHKKIIQAAKEEFLKKGFEKANIRDIGTKAGVTSAALYRHCKDKEDLFCQVVEPAISAIDEWLSNHINNAYKNADKGDSHGLQEQSEVDMIREVGIPHRDEFRLLLTKSSGTKYENFLNVLVNQHEVKLWEGLEYLQKHGYQIKQVEKEEMHILINAYMTALFEPLIHDYDEAQILHYLNTVENFFMPGWLEIWGLKKIKTS